MDRFNREKGGSKRMEDLVKKYNSKEVQTSSIDLLDLWKEIERWPKFDIIKTEKQKYIFTFLKLNPTTFTVNLKELERFYVRTTKKNKKYKVEEMEEILIAQRDNLTIIGLNDGQDPNDSLHFESKVKIKGGVRYNKGSVEELIHHLIEYSKKNKEGDKSLLEIFKTKMDSQSEVDTGTFKEILDQAGIKSSQQQVNDIFKILDSDKDRMISYGELLDFIDTYKEDQSLSSNLFKNIGGKKNKFKKLKEILDIKCDLKPEEDYFLSDCTTILNSDIAALKQVEVLLDNLENSGAEAFIDLEFGPKDKDDEEGNKMSLYTTGEAPPGYIKPEQIEWIYPKEMCEEGADIQFLVDESSSNEVIQGALGD